MDQDTTFSSCAERDATLAAAGQARAGAWRVVSAIIAALHLKENSPMTEAKIAQKGPYPVEVEAGKSYYWCACGQSAKQPFCDGSHKGGDFTPVKFEAAESKTVYFCGCKHSGNPVLCDGSHAKL
jgi:CDGSH-type Zn-finger protein